MRAKTRQHTVMRGGVAVPLTPISERACLGKVQHESWDDADEARCRLPVETPPTSAARKGEVFSWQQL